MIDIPRDDDFMPIFAQSKSPNYFEIVNNLS